MKDKDKTKEQLIDELAKSEAERKKVEEKLRESEEQFKNIVEISTDGYLCADLKGRITDCNSAFLSHTGYTRKDFVNKHFTKLPTVRVKDIPQYIKMFNAAIRGKAQKSIEYRWIHKDGTTRWGEGHFGIVKKKSKISGFHITTRDTTYRKRAEEALKESEEKLRIMFESIEDGIVVTDVEANIIKVNNAILRMGGYSHKEEFIGRGAIDFVSPNDRAKAMENLSKELEAGNSKGNIEYALLAKDGSEFYVESNATALHDSSGNHVGLINVIRDITQRKKAEQIQASLYNISEASQSAENLEGFYQIIHEIITKLMPAKNNFYIALYDADSKMFSFPYFVDEYEENPGLQKFGKGLTEHVLRTEKPLLASPEVFEELVKKGNVVSVGPPSIDWLGVPLKTKGKIIGVLVVQSYAEGLRYSEEDKNILMFISDHVAMAIERKKAEEKLKTAHENLQKLTEHLQKVREAERMSIAREIHDDVGQNLAALKMDMYMMEKKLPSDQKPLFDRMKTMIELTDQTVQTVRRIHEELRPTFLEEGGFVEAIKLYMKEFESKSEAKCELHIEPKSIDLSEERSLAVFRILQESMTNVRLHSGATKVSVSIKEKNGKVELIVKDNGIGIVEEQLSKSDSFGLIGIRERVDFLGGEVKIKGISGKGTTVAVAIPLKAAK
jgi:PAS domain S-box-containing protein